MKYNHFQTEKKWAEKWVKDKTFTLDLKKAENPYYALFMFPYPSAEGLHIGNFYAFTCVDVIAKYKKLKGFDVFEPFGFDAFGMHSENYALKINQRPRVMLDRTENNFRKQLVASGIGCDWTREVNTTHPQYYKWTQWIFLQLFKKNLAFQKKALLNWCPDCKTVLADEQIESGVCERCKAIPEKKEMKQWFFEITSYAQKLLDELDQIDWSETTKSAQRNWIGRKQGAEVDFTINEEKVPVFTTRPDTLFGATYFVLSPEHPLTKKISENNPEVKKYVDQAAAKSDLERTEFKEKTGVFTNLYAVNPVNNEKIPVWVADYVLMNYGTGAVMAVPAHDERDFEFASKYNLEIKEVVAPFKKAETREDKETFKREIVVALVRNPKNNKYLCLDWKKVSWKSFPTGGTDGEDLIEAGKREAREETGYKNLRFIEQIGGPIFSEFYRPHKDSNVFAYFRYLLFELENEEKEEVSEEEKEKHTALWVNQEEVSDFINVWNQKIAWQRHVDGISSFSDDGIAINSGDYDNLFSQEAREKICDWLEEKKLGRRKINYKLRDWCISRQRYWGPPIPVIYCDKCGVVPVPEKDLPVLLPDLEENWQPAGDGKGPLAKVKNFIETKCPQCGLNAQRESDVMDNFLDSSWYFFRYLSPDNDKEIFSSDLKEKWLPVDLYIGGNEHAVLHLMYTRFITMFFNDLKLIDFNNPFKKFRANGMILKDGKKMSKSKGNVVNPEEYGKEIGYDALKTYLLFLGPLSDDKSFSDSGVLGTKRWVDKIFRLKDKVEKGFQDQQDVLFKINEAIEKTENDLEDQKYNTAIAWLMETTNFLSSKEKISLESWLKFLALVAPFTPALAEELWMLSGQKESIFNGKNWPEKNKNLTEGKKVNLIVQINGKVRDSLIVSTGLSQQEAEKVVLEREKVKKWINEKKIQKIVFIEDKLINIVI
jgi:leucyl-tRNA synthetase